MTCTEHAISGFNRRVTGHIRAFTLVELLVVVSIIALLISILLPSLKKARDQAKTLKCQANLRAIGQASFSYQMEADEWLPGAAGTTGSMLLLKYDGTDGARVDIPEAPVQVWDWAGPLASVEMGMNSLPTDRAERFRFLTQDYELFVCPTNRFLAVPYPSTTADWRDQKMISYNTTRGFMMWPRTITPNATPSPLPDKFDGLVTFNRVGGNTDLPGNYAPRLDRVGQPSEKILLSDGARYTEDDGIRSYNFDWDASLGGAFCGGSPTIPELALRSFGIGDPERRYSYRHDRAGRPGLNGLYFDGHAEWTEENNSRLPNAWWPKGTIIPIEDFNRPAFKKLFELGMLPQDGLFRVRR